mmetsp:Transcript_31851/g.74441  ORF Transcript_31851/g.74441 Transcript_31851/m.74441 type:complete len:245 (+) Transcript_31851:322-1056(+)
MSNVQSQARYHCFSFEHKVASATGAAEVDDSRIYCQYPQLQDGAGSFDIISVSLCASSFTLLSTALRSAGGSAKQCPKRCSNLSGCHRSRPARSCDRSRAGWLCMSKCNGLVLGPVGKGTSLAVSRWDSLADWKRCQSCSSFALAAALCSSVNSSAGSATLPGVPSAFVWSGFLLFCLLSGWPAVEEDGCPPKVLPEGMSSHDGASSAGLLCLSRSFSMAASARARCRANSRASSSFATSCVQW